jgi:hypothetical protein
MFLLLSVYFPRTEYIYRVPTVTFEYYEKTVTSWNQKDPTVDR